jgi:predicted nucleic acid-binding protein
VGAEGAASGNARGLLRGLGRLPSRFAGRILDIDSRIAEAWGVVMARNQRAGLNMGSLDAFFVATVEVYRFTLVTRDVQHFEKLGIPLLNPWQGSQA